MKICGHIFCPSDFRIATKHFDSRESEFPPTNHNVHLIVDSTIMLSFSENSENFKLKLYQTHTNKELQLRNLIVF